MEPTQENKVKAMLDRIVANGAYTENDLKTLAGLRDQGYIECQDAIKFHLGLPVD